MRIFAAMAAPCAVFAGTLAAQTTPPPLPISDPDIQGFVADISAERIQRSVVVLSSFKTRHTLSDPQPSGDGIGAAGAWIRAQFERVAAGSGGRLRVTEDEFNQALPGVPHPVGLVNIVATLTGSRPDSSGRVYVISAHYDSVGKDLLDAQGAAPGANDNAAGVAAMLEVARALAQADFPATLVFLAVSGGEQGSFGSSNWAETARREHREIAGMFDDDMLGNTHAADGRVDRHTVRLFAGGIPPLAQPSNAAQELIRAGGENDSGPRQLARAIRDLARVYVPGVTVQVIYRGNQYSRAGDSDSFLLRGYPAVRFAEPFEDFGHLQEPAGPESGVRSGDLPDWVDFAYVADVARINAAALASLALAPAVPAAVQLETGRPESDPTLRWFPNPEAGLAGYRVVWRDTLTPYWEHFRDVPKNQVRINLPGVARDNFVFGVEAFDAAGHLSPAGFALPALAP